jgi:hypothetical protein
MTTVDRQASQRTLTITACVPKKTGQTQRGRDWTLYGVEALTKDGHDVVEELVSFEKLPIGVEQEFDVKKRERRWRDRVYVSYCLSIPKAEEEQVSAPQMPLVPAGRYAVQGVDGSWTLLRVWRGTKNPNVQQLYRVEGTEKGVRLGKVEERLAAVAIARDPGQAAIDFGHRTGSCSRCGEELKKNLSRMLGIGPVCMKHWFANDDRLARMAVARQQLRDAGFDPEDSYADLAIVKGLVAA